MGWGSGDLHAPPIYTGNPAGVCGTRTCTENSQFSCGWRSVPPRINRAARTKIRLDLRANSFCEIAYIATRSLQSGRRCVNRARFPRFCQQIRSSSTHLLVALSLLHTPQKFSSLALLQFSSDNISHHHGPRKGREGARRPSRSNRQ